MSTPLSRVLADRCADVPERVAVVSGSAEITYQELGERVSALATRLAVALGQPSVVGLAAPRGIDSVVGMLATWWAGCTYLALDPAQPAERLRDIVMIARADLVLLPAGARPSTWAGDVPVAEIGAERGGGTPPRSPADVAYVVFTSGSTGQPKGIEMPAAAVARLAEWHRRGDDQAGVRTAHFAAMGFDVAVQEVLATLLCGGTLVVVDEDSRRDPARLLELVHTQRVHRLFLPTAALQPIAEQAARGGGGESLRDVVCAGDQLRVTPAIRCWFGWLGARLHNHYGPAETHVVTAHVLSGDPADWPDVAPIGLPLPHVQLEVTGTDPTEPGELVIRGEQLARGYTGRPDLSAERFVGTGEARGYRTGDLVEWRDGVLVFCGRRDRQVKIRGYRVELDEVEAHLAQHPQLAESAVDVVEAAGQREMVAYIVPAANRVPVREVREFLAERLPAYMLPTRLHVLDYLPLTVNGKLDRAAAADLVGPLCPVGKPMPGSDRGIESLVTSAFERVLGHCNFARDENFFDIGGTSARAVRVSTLIADALAMELPVVMFYDNPSVASLTSALAQRTPIVMDDARGREGRRNVRARAQSASREARRRRRTTS